MLGAWIIFLFIIFCYDFFFFFYCRHNPTIPVSNQIICRNISMFCLSTNDSLKKKTIPPTLGDCEMGWKCVCLICSGLYVISSTDEPLKKKIFFSSPPLKKSLEKIRKQTLGKHNNSAAGKCWLDLKNLLFFILCFFFFKL